MAGFIARIRTQMLLSDQIIIILLFFLTFWLVVLSYLIFKAYRTYTFLTSDIDKKTFTQVLSQLKLNQKQTQTDLKYLETNLETVNTKIKTHIQKFGFIRYNPFGNTGGDQSFCLCLLDEADNGIMITSLHTRDQTRIYAKAIKNGHNQDQAPLSKEELQCIKHAQKWSHHE